MYKKIEKMYKKKRQKERKCIRKRKKMYKKKRVKETNSFSFPVPIVAQRNEYERGVRQLSPHKVIANCQTYRVNQLVLVSV